MGATSGGGRLTTQYCASLSMFNARVKAAKILLESGATPQEVREIHGAFVLLAAREELAKIKERGRMRETRLQSPGWR